MRLIDVDAFKAEHRMADMCGDCKRTRRELDCDLCDCCDWLDNAPTVREWISVKKKLPEQAGYSCLVSAEYGDGKRAEFIAFTGYGESEWYTYDALFMEKEREADNRVHHNYHITHWMPLPEPPEVKQDD